MPFSKLLFLLLIAFCCGSLPASSPLRIATVNLEKAFNGYYKTKIIAQDFAEQNKVYAGYIARQAEQLRKGEQELRKKLDASLNAALAPAERQRRQNEVQTLERELKRRRAELEQYAADRAKALQESSRKERQKVIEEIRAEIRRRAAIEGYALVLDSSGMSINDTSIVLYSIDALDITDKVITELNRGAKAPAANQNNSKN